MVVAIHHHSETPADSFSWKWAQALQRRQFDVRLLDFRSTQAFEQIRECSAAMWHWYHLPEDKQVAPKILSAIEHGLKLPVFPDVKTCWHYDEKVAQHYLLGTLDVPRVKTWVFWNRGDALNFIKGACYPLVFKLSVGAGAANVLKVENYSDAKAKVNAMFGAGIFPYSFNEFAPENSEAQRSKLWWLPRLGRAGRQSDDHWYGARQRNYIYLQEFLPGNSHDIRITIIGNRAFGFTRKNRDGDFRASGSGKLDYDPAGIPPAALAIAFQVSKSCRFQSMAYDFLVDRDRNVKLNEFSYAFLNSAVYDCPGFWDSDFVFHPGRYWPEELQVEDFLAGFPTNGRS
jgi:glutathione synthase/RimK-type ligase-like ATP-grasp enzyme